MTVPGEVGESVLLPKVRFVITLDSDTQLPRGSAQRMVGAMAHPLNQAVIDPKDNIVIAGYGILQPRVGISVDSTAQSRLAAISSADRVGYRTRGRFRRLSGSYGEGSFTGKGIYEVDALRQCWRALPTQRPPQPRPDRRRLCPRGAGQRHRVIEDYPSHYSAYNRRKHRWLRGDWQIMRWLSDQVPDERARRCETRSRSSRAGRSWTTCGGVW